MQRFYRSFFLCSIIFFSACTTIAIHRSDETQQDSNLEKNNRDSLEAIIESLTLKPTYGLPERWPSFVNEQSIPEAWRTNLRWARWEDLPNTQWDDFSRVWNSFHQFCEQNIRHTIAKNSKQTLWKDACQEALLYSAEDNVELKRWLRRNFWPAQILQADRTVNGLLTAYYEPRLRGSRIRSDIYQYPILGTPSDLLNQSCQTETGETINRARRELGKIKPYYTRGEIEARSTLASSNILFWVADPIELYFLQVQGSGIIALDDGSEVRIGFANHNGYPYVSIGKILVDSGVLPIEQASMSGIQNWAHNNPSRARELLAQNRRYIFFKEMGVVDPNTSGPVGALGMPLVPERSIAVDTHFIPLGMPVFLESIYPKTSVSFSRWVLAQDEGAAIKGPVRADLFWGSGAEAGNQAGSVRQPLKMWILVPKRLWVSCVDLQKNNGEPAISCQ